MYPTILVTAATGTIGTELVKELRARGIPVRAGVHSLERGRTLQNEGVEVMHFDFDSPLSMKACLRGISKVFLTTPLSQTMVERTNKFIDLCKHGTVEQIVKLSSFHSDHHNGTLLGEMHRKSEEHLRASGMQWTILRSNAFFQNFLTTNAPTNGFIYLAMREGPVSYVDARDVAAVGATIISGGSYYFVKEYDLTGPEGLTIEDIAQQLSEITQMHVGFIDISESAERHAMQTHGIPEWKIDMISEERTIQRLGLAKKTTNYIHEILSREPTTFASFAHQNSDLFKANILDLSHTFSEPE